MMNKSDGVNPLHEAARAYANQGIPVFPCNPGTKIPLAGTNGFRDASTDLSRIDEWWTEYPDANIGMYLHGAGLCAVDIDGSRGAASWLEFDLDHDIPETREIRTPSGGRHLIFKGTLPSTVGKLAPGIDTRGEGGYVVAPPSSVEATEGKPAGFYSVIHDRKPAPLPGWIAQALAARAAPRKAHEGVMLDQPHNVWRAGEYLKALVRRGDVAIEGQGGDLRTYQVACKVSDMGLSEDAAFEKMRDQWNAHCQPPWDEDELRTKVQNACRYGQNEPGCDARPSGIEVFGNLPSVKKLLAESAAKADPDEFKETLLIRRADQIEMKATTWLWPDRFPMRRVSLLAGHGDVGKSTMLMDLAARISRGKEWPDGRGNAPLGNVVYLGTEDDAEETLVPRFVAAGGDRAKFYIVDGVRGEDGRRTFSLADDLDMLERHVRAVGNVVAVILDPINSYFGDTDTFKASRVRKVLEPLMPMAKALGVAIIGNTHFNKAAKGGGTATMRVLDSGAITAFSRAIYVVNKDPEDEHARLFQRSKGNLGKPVDGLRFYFKERPVKPGLPPASYVDWTDDAVTASADSTLRANEGEAPKRTKIEDAMDFFREILADGPQPTNKVMQAAITEGHTEATLRGARRPPKLKLVVNNNAEDW